ncbi:hypothetical protein ACO0K9_22160 [Undibacterium sp. Ji50W]|uniref:hypothetical protein n=1 Tax=Undibacterium sp. Ji50W TaxID=3413041 RepID=UPI003BF0A695
MHLIAITADGTSGEEPGVAFSIVGTNAYAKIRRTFANAQEVNEYCSRSLKMGSDILEENRKRKKSMNTATSINAVLGFVAIMVVFVIFRALGFHR